MTDKNSLPHGSHQEHGGPHVLAPQGLPHQVLHHAPGQKLIENDYLCSTIIMRDVIVAVRC